ncbi:MAG: D-2-hydroxyacid dehydrogenase [Oscillospiraceae bacterium]
MKVWINAPFSAENIQLISRAAKGCEVFSGNELIPEADIIVGQPAENTDFTRLKLLQSTNAGVEKLISAGIPENVAITNVTGAFGEVISEYITAGILAFCRGLFRYRDNQRRHIWQIERREILLNGKNALILGCGDIGGAAAKRLRAFGMRIAGIRREPKKTEYFDSVYGMDSLDGLLSDADVIICCLPHTAQTCGVLSAERILRMKHGAILVNVGRGSLIDEAALAEALQNGRLFGAVLDVFEKEPLPENSPLWDMENVIITPHISGPSFGHFPEVERKIAEICAENVARFISGEPLINVIDKAKGYAEKRAGCCHD